MSTNDNIVESLTRHQIMIQRYGSGVYKDLEPILKDMLRSIRSRMLDEPTDFQLFRMQTLIDDIKQILRDGGAQINDELFDRMIEFAEYESEFTQRVIDPFVTVNTILPPVDQLAAAVTNEQMNLVSGKKTKTGTIRDLVDQFTTNKQNDVDRIIRSGFIEGKTSQQMVGEISQLVGKTARAQAATLVRTATNHAGSVARASFYRRNSDIIEYERWVSTLDDRTTFVCMSLDGDIFQVGEGPQTPRHFGCRSLRVPHIEPKYSILGTDKGQRASKFGPVSAQLTYSGFLRQQSKEFQDDVLGPTRAKLFRSGELTLDKFVDDMGRLLTLDELRQREGITI